MDILASGFIYNQPPINGSLKPANKVENSTGYVALPEME